MKLYQLLEDIEKLKVNTPNLLNYDVVSGDEGQHIEEVKFERDFVILFK